MAYPKFTKRAIEDLTDIYDYTFNHWSEYQADKYYYELIDVAKTISGEPRIGRLYTKLGLDVYGFPINRHILFYRIVESENVEIIRILGSDMDLKEFLV